MFGISLLCGALALCALGPEPADQAFGYYSKGSLEHASALEMQGEGYVHLFQARGRHYGTQGLLEIIQSAAVAMERAYPGGERLQIGDVAAEHGGFVSGHASHQNGLDVDIAYFRANHREQDPAYLAGYDEKFVENGHVTPNFDVARSWAVLKAIVSSGRVNRIFVDPAIKRALCSHADAAGEGVAGTETLRRLRPYPNHDDHFHVRIDCPPTSPKCVKQDEVPPGSGCQNIDSELLSAFDIMEE